MARILGAATPSTEPWPTGSEPVVVVKEEFDKPNERRDGPDDPANGAWAIRFCIGLALLLDLLRVRFHPAALPSSRTPGGLPGAGYSGLMAGALVRRCRRTSRFRDSARTDVVWFTGESKPAHRPASGVSWRGVDTPRELVEHAEDRARACPGRRGVRALHLLLTRESIRPASANGSTCSSSTVSGRRAAVRSIAQRRPVRLEQPRGGRLHG